MLLDFELAGISGLRTMELVCTFALWWCGCATLAGGKSKHARETAALQVEDLTYNADGLIPCIVQDEQTREVLMMAWMNEEAVRRTISQGTTWFWSRSRQKFWHKGEESGNTQKLVELRYDCDADTLLAVVNPAGPACHTGETTCFYRSF